jgi:hypothetical protein
MWMVIKIACMRMQDSMCSDAAPQLRIAAGKTIKRLPGCFEEEIIGDPLIPPKQTPQLYRHSDCDHKIVDIEQFCLLSFQPSLAFVMLAVGTAAVPTGMGETNLMLATMAFQHHDAAVLIAATSEGLEGLIMTRQKIMAVSLLQIAGIACDQIGKQDHQMSSHRSASPDTRSSMRSLAC